MILFFCKQNLLVTTEQNKLHILIRSSAVKMSGKLFDGLDAKLWHISAQLVGGLLESFTRLWLTQRGTVHPLNAPSATTVSPKTLGCQPASTHAWWRVTLKAEGPVAPLQPLSGTLDKANLWAYATGAWMSVCINSVVLQCKFWNVCQ